MYICLFSVLLKLSQITFPSVVALIVFSSMVLMLTSCVYSFLSSENFNFLTERQPLSSR